MTFFKKIYTILFFASFCSYAQVLTKEVFVVTDNDLYTSSKNDKYYTNGLFIGFRYLGKKSSENVEKQINEFSVGHCVYTPRYLNVEAVDIQDRPFAGYLFGSYNKSLFYKNENVLKLGMQLGTIGPNAFAQEFQENFHHIFGYKEVFGWEKQIGNAFAFQTNLMFSKKLFPNQKTNFFDFHWKSNAQLGTIFTGLNTGFLARIGFKELSAITQSGIYGGTVGSVKQSNDDFYFFAAPSIRYQLYDATIQGSLFNGSSVLTFPIQHLRFNAEAGLAYQKKNWNLSYTFVYTTKEVAESPAIGNFYGSISVSYLW